MEAPRSSVIERQRRMLLSTCVAAKEIDSLGIAIATRQNSKSRIRGFYTSVEREQANLQVNLERHEGSRFFMESDEPALFRFRGRNDLRACGRSPLLPSSTVGISIMLRQKTVCNSKGGCSRQANPAATKR